MQISNILLQNKLSENIYGQSSDNNIQNENSYDTQNNTEIQKTQPKRTEQSEIENTLKSLGFKTNDENVKMVNTLINNDLPITKSNLQKLNQTLKLMGENSEKEAIFLIKNEISPTVANTDILKGYLNGTTNISNSLNSVLTALSSDTQNEEILALLNKLTENSISKSDIKLFNDATEQLKQIFSNKKVINILDDYINSSDFHEKISEFKNNVQTSASEPSIKENNIQNAFNTTNSTNTLKPNNIVTSQSNNSYENLEKQISDTSSNKITVPTNNTYNTQYTDTTNNQMNQNSGLTINNSPIYKNATTNFIDLSIQTQNTESSSNIKYEANNNTTITSQNQNTNNTTIIEDAYNKSIINDNTITTNNTTINTTTNNTPINTFSSENTQYNIQNPSDQTTQYYDAQTNPQQQNPHGNSSVSFSKTDSTQHNPVSSHNQTNPQQQNYQGNSSVSISQTDSAQHNPVSSHDQTNPQQQNPQGNSSVSSSKTDSAQRTPVSSDTITNSQYLNHKPNTIQISQTTDIKSSPTNSTTQYNVKQTQFIETTQNSNTTISIEKNSPTSNEIENNNTKLNNTLISSQEHKYTQNNYQLNQYTKTIQPQNFEKTEVSSSHIKQLSLSNNTISPIEQLMNKHKNIFIPILEKSINSGSLDMFRKMLSNYGFNEKFSIPELSSALEQLLPENSKLKTAFNLLPEVKIALSFSLKSNTQSHLPPFTQDTENTENQQISQNIIRQQYRQNTELKPNDITKIQYGNVIEENDNITSKLSYEDKTTYAKIPFNNAESKSTKNIENNTKKQETITFDKLFFQNKELLLPQIKKSISENSLAGFKEFLSNMGYKEHLSLVEMNNTLKTALWNNKELLQKFSDIPEVKSALSEYKTSKHTENTVTKKELPDSIPEKNTFSLNDFTIKDLKKIFESAFKNYPKLNERTQKILNVKESFMNKAMKNLSLDFSKEYDELNNYSENFTKKLNNIQSEINSVQSPVSNEISSEIKNIMNNLEFSSQFKDTTYFQIPIIINNNQTTAELYIFKNKTKNKNSKSSSAVLSLDLAFLGHFEAYISKAERNISCQFKTENKNIEKLISSKISDLNNALKNYNYNLKQVTFKELDEKFTVISKEPSLIKKGQKKSSFALDITT